MRETTFWRRVAAATGLLFPILLLVGDDVIAGGDRVAPDAGAPEEVLANLAETDTTAYFVGRSIGQVSIICLFIFAAYVATQLRRQRGPESILPQLAVGAGAIAAAGGLATGLLQLTLVQREGAGLTPELAVTLLELSFGFEALMLPLAVLIGVVAIEGVRGTIVARWIGWAAAVLAAGFVAGAFVGSFGGDAAGVSFLPVMLSWPWFVVASISMIRRAGAGADTVVGRAAPAEALA